MSFQVTAANVAQANTPETDTQPEVPHHVHIQLDGDSRVLKIIAADPMDAIERVQRMDERLVRALSMRDYDLEESLIRIRYRAAN